MTTKDISITNAMPTSFVSSLHIDFLSTYDEKNKNDYDMTEYLRMSGIYWSLTALNLLNSSDSLDQKSLIEFVKSCQTSNGGFSPAPRHDPNILYTLSAVQILCIYDQLDCIDVDQVALYISKSQKEDGSFVGDEWNEVDTRFSFCAVATLALIGRLWTNTPIDINKCVDFLMSCMNFDGGFGCRPGSESHSGQIYCCLGTLSILHKLHLADSEALGWWLCERQLPSGGLNGRPDKLPDVCYSWWVLSSLSIIGKLHWIDKDSLVKFILASQDDETGGIADRPGDLPDPFHTLFGICGLSLLGDRRLKTINSVFCMPQNVIDRLKIKVQILPS